MGHASRVPGGWAALHLEPCIRGGRGSYNGAMDDPPIIDGPEVEEPEVSVDVEETEQGKAPAQADVVFEGLATGKEPWKGSGCSSRLPLYGCMFGLVVLIGFLIAGTSMMRRTVWVNMERGRRVVVQSLPRSLPAAERQRTIQNLERFRAVLDASKDPYPTMGEFMNRVQDILRDGRLTAEEIGGLNVYLERVIEESGIPPMQLGRRILNSEFGILNSRPPSPGFSGWMGDHSELRIPNSEFA